MMPNGTCLPGRPRHIDGPDALRNKLQATNEQFARVQHGRVTVTVGHGRQEEGPVLTQKIDTLSVDASVQSVADFLAPPQPQASEAFS